jgi:hypothetical protein
VLTSYFPAGKPTKQEYNNADRIELTYPDPEWSPNDVWFSEEENCFVHEDGSMTLYDKKYNRRIFSCATFNDEYLVLGLQGNVLVLHQETSDSSDVTISAIETNQKFTMSPEELCRTWRIGLLAAKKTLVATTQNGVRSVAFPNVECRWATGDRPLRYRRLNCQVYHDTLKASIASLRGNKFMKKESDVHETLDLFLSRYGLPEALVSDGARAYLGGKFRNKQEKQTDRPV